MTTPFVCFSGRSNSGKTTVVQNVIRELVSRGHNVGAVKHTHHDFSDNSGTDTFKMQESGASKVCLVSNNSMRVFGESPRGPEDIVAFYDGYDIVIFEGFKDTGKNIIEVVGEDALPIIDGSILKISRSQSKDGFLGSDSVSEITDFIEKKVMGI